MQPKEVDLCVIGGGINGVGVAADAAGRGLSVILCEKDDLAGHTSSASTKLIHGGLRYLEQYEFNMVREALREREVLLRIAPHLVHPLEFILPFQAGMRPAWLIRAGLFLYDHLARRVTLPSSRALEFHGGPLQSRLQRGFSYWDCQTDDARLVVTNALSAQRFGAEIATRTRVEEIELTPAGWLVTARNANGEKRLIIARALVNAAGAWVAQLHQLALGRPASTTMTWVKGSHIVIPKWYAGEQAYILQTPDNRVVFVLPYQRDYTFIGTTDVVFEGDPDNVTMSTEERDYMLDVVNQYMERPIAPSDILLGYAGIRTLVGQPEAGAAKMTRGYHLECVAGAGSFPLISVFGGKLTSYRLLAQAVMHQLVPFFPGCAGEWTATVPLPGGDLGGKSLAEFIKQLEKTYHNLPAALLRDYATRYGNLTYRVLGTAQHVEDLGPEFGPGCYAAELRYLIQHEWAQTAEDILWRRTQHGLALTPAQRQAVAVYLQDNCLLHFPPYTNSQV